jgi:hypothetical protein
VSIIWHGSSPVNLVIYWSFISEARGIHGAGNLEVLAVIAWPVLPIAKCIEMCVVS